MPNYLVDLRHPLPGDRFTGRRMTVKAPNQQQAVRQGRLIAQRITGWKAESWSLFSVERVGESAKAVALNHSRHLRLPEVSR